MLNNYKILELFPTPILTYNLPQEYSEVVPWFYKQELRRGFEGEEEIDLNYGVRSENSYILDEPECENLKNHILTLVNSYGQLLGFDYKEYKFSQSWLSYKYPNQHHTVHTHPNSLISGVLFFGSSTHKTPAIKFHKFKGSMNYSFIVPKKKKTGNKYSPDIYSLDFVPGTLLLFPSYLQHSVPLNTTNEVRCSLAFNVIPPEGFGNEVELTELKF